MSIDKEIKLNRKKRLKRILDDQKINANKLADQMEACPNIFRSKNPTYIYRVLDKSLDNTVSDNLIDDVLKLFPNYRREWLAGEPSIGDDDVRRFKGADIKLSNDYLFASMFFLLSSIGYNVEPVFTSKDSAGSNFIDILDIWSDAECFNLSLGKLKYTVSGSDMKSFMGEMIKFAGYSLEQYIRKADA